MVAFQVCLQVWLTTSLLADGLAVAGQAILASAFARRDYDKATATTSRVLQVHINMLESEMTYEFVAGTQPINPLAFVFDGINFGASDFAYSAYSMVLVAVISIICLIFLSITYQFIGIWVALTIYTSLRASAGFSRIGTGTGPWNFLRSL